MQLSVVTDTAVAGARRGSAPLVWTGAYTPTQQGHWAIDVDSTELFAADDECAGIGSGNSSALSTRRCGQCTALQAYIFAVDDQHAAAEVVAGTHWESVDAVHNTRRATFHSRVAAMHGIRFAIRCV